MGGFLIRRLANLAFVLLVVTGSLIIVAFPAHAKANAEPLIGTSLRYTGALDAFGAGQIDLHVNGVMATFAYEVSSRDAMGRSVLLDAAIPGSELLDLKMIAAVSCTGRHGKEQRLKLQVLVETKSALLVHGDLGR